MLSRRSRIVLIVLAIVSAAVPLVSQMRTVSRVGIVARPRLYRGPCPANIEFVATIFVTHHPVWVSYRWERSDGAIGPRQRTEIRSAGQGISTTWNIGGRHRHLQIWERLHVLAPTGITSPPATVRLNCE
jgi:hypothetical protein